MIRPTRSIRNDPEPRTKLYAAPTEIGVGPRCTGGSGWISPQRQRVEARVPDGRGHYLVMPTARHKQEIERAGNKLAFYYKALTRGWRQPARFLLSSRSRAAISASSATSTKAPRDRVRLALGRCAHGCGSPPIGGFAAAGT
jgi:hypothetical protein